MDIVPAVLYLLLTLLNALALAEHDRPAHQPEPPVAPCDPGFGFPEPRSSCPDTQPLVGLVTAYADGTATVVPRGGDGPWVVRVNGDTVRTGAILVGYEEPLHDHRVPCQDFGERRFPGVAVPAAVWFDGDRLVQLSELYRP